MSHQSIKDTFYSMVRDRIAALNPGRTIVLRGSSRPAVVVAENELPSASPIAGTFTLSWSALAVDPLGLIKLICEIHYATAGTTGAGGMDRGRALAAMDAELATTLNASPQNAALISFAEVTGGGASTQSTPGGNLFWASPVFNALVARSERLERSATVEVFGYE